MYFNNNNNKKTSPLSSINECFVFVGVCVGAGCSMSVLKSVLERSINGFPPENTHLFRALLLQLNLVGGQQIRNVAVSVNRP